MPEMPLKWKYRNPLRKGPKGQAAKMRTGHKLKDIKDGSGNHRPSYGPFWFLEFGSQLPIGG